jgi:poly(A) polymerase
MTPLRIPRDQHDLSRKDIDPDTLKVLYKLKDAGYEAYLVGGAVRDVFSGRRPKDFDVATDARPNDLRRLFRNSRIVGRRFRLVHVFFGPKNIEVATLRSAVEPPDAEGDLYCDDDNQWGDLESDAFRRDFTCNALYYDIRDFSVIDHCGGVHDITERVIRAIGDPNVRFQEDPVRMLRALKFAARFGFDLETATADAIMRHAGEIHKASRFRVTEEVFRIISQANRGAGLDLLWRAGFLHQLYPDWVRDLGQDGIERGMGYFAALDKAATADRFYPMEIVATGLFIPLVTGARLDTGRFNAAAAQITAEVRRLSIHMDLPKRLTNGIVEMLRGQLYLLAFAHLPGRVRRFVDSPWFDPVWRVHELAFGHTDALKDLRTTWLEARNQVRRPIGGLVDGPDRRDIFSFRGKTGGGRYPNGRDGDAGSEDEPEFAEPQLVDSGDEG